MAQGVPLRVKISADLADIKRGLGLLRGDLQKVKAEAARSAPDGAKWGQGFRAARREVLQFVAAVASIRTIWVFASLSDEATQLRGRLKAAGGDYERILKLAQETRTGLSSTVDLYARMERATRGQGVSQERLLKITRAVNQAVKLSYADAGTAEAALTQFAQGLAAGRLAGQDLNSVIAGTPVIAESIAKGLGKQVSEIKELGKQGALSTQQVLGAMENQVGALEAEYAAVPVTISDAFTQIRNSFLDYIGDQNEATGAAQAFSSTLQGVARDLPQFFEPILQVTASLAKNLQDVKKTGEDAAGAMMEGGTQASFMAGAGQFLANVFRVIAVVGIGVKNVVESITVVLTAMVDIAMEVSRTIAGNLGRTFGAIAGTWATLKDKGPVAAMEAWRDSAKTLFDDVAGLPGRVATKVGVATEMVGENLAELVKGFQAVFGKVDDLTRKTGGSRGGGDGAGGTTGDPLGGDKLADSMMLHRDRIARALAELDRLYKDNEVSIREYFETRLQLQQQDIDAQIAQARSEAAAAKNVGARRKAEEEITKLLRDRAELGAAAAREQAKAEEELVEQLGEVKLRLMELDGQDVAVARARFESEYKDMLKRLEKEGDKTGQAMVYNLIDRLTSKAQLDQFSSRFQTITQGLSGREASLSAQLDVGAIGGVEGERQLNEVRTASLVKLQELRREAAAYLATLDPGSPEAASALQFMGQLDQSIAGVKASQQKLVMTIEDSAKNALSGFFMDLVDGAKSFKDAFKDMVRSFVQGVAQMIAQELALQAVRAASRAFGAGVAHSGGIAGMLATVRSGISPLMLGEAPRYHSGGIAGGAPDEVHAILQRGEEVLTKSDPRHRFNGGVGAGDGSSRVSTPIVAIGDDAVANAMAGAAGERVILTVVRNNWEGLHRGV